MSFAMLVLVLPFLVLGGYYVTALLVLAGAWPEHAEQLAHCWRTHVPALLVAETAWLAISMTTIGYASFSLTLASCTLYLLAGCAVSALIGVALTLHAREVGQA
jgi:hypothetical protein